MSEHHHALFQYLGSYYHAASNTPDVHEGPFQTKADAWLSARAKLRETSNDPSAVLDLTNVASAEVGAYLR